MARHTDPWSIRSLVLGDQSSAVVDGLLLPTIDAPWLREIHSIRATMVEDGTGDLASMFIADGPIRAAGFNNNDQEPMQATQSNAGANTLWHWGRTNQLGTQGQETQYMPPDFLWEGEMWAWLQNGSGAVVFSLFTVVERRVRFSRREYVDLVAKVMPGTIVKERIEFL